MLINGIATVCHQQAACYRQEVLKVPSGTEDGNNNRNHTQTSGHNNIRCVESPLRHFLPSFLSTLDTEWFPFRTYSSQMVVKEHVFFNHVIISQHAQQDPSFITLKVLDVTLEAQLCINVQHEEGLVHLWVQSIRLRLISVDN